MPYFPTFPTKWLSFLLFEVLSYFPNFFEIFTAHRIDNSLTIIQTIIHILEGGGGLETESTHFLAKMPKYRFSHASMAYVHINLSLDLSYLSNKI